MSSSENGKPGSTAREGEMLASAGLTDGNHTLRLCRDSSLDTKHGHKLPKFSLNMKNYCSIHLRLLHNLNEDTRHDIFMLNPECHLKFLEQNLNCLSKKPGRCNDFKISCSKSSTCRVETSQKVLSLPENRLPSLAIASFSEGSVSRLKTIERKFDNSCKDTVVLNGSKIKMSNVSFQKRMADKPILGTPSIIKIKEKYSSKNDRSHDSHFEHMNFKPVATDKTAESLKNKTDIDNQFEFTVAGEKIVSFVCSPPASRRQRTKGTERNYICDSDEESTESSSKGSSETASNTSSKSSNSKCIKINNTLNTQEQAMKTKMLLWQPSSNSRAVGSFTTQPGSFSSSSLNRKIKQKPNESYINFFGTINSLYAVSSTNERKLKNCHNQETVMFRETALRGCYDIDTLLKEVNLASPDIEKEVNQTRDAIFSAVRLQRGNDSVVTDSVQSIVDICNSWIKLNAHFERKDFKHFLETNEVDLSILGDFAQWQCMSRIFVDKLINVLKKVTLGKDSNITIQHDSVQKRGSAMASVAANVMARAETFASNPRRAGNTSIPATEFQGKRWTERSILSDKTDSEREALAIIRPCRSTFLLDSCIQNPLMANNCKTDTVFGQGDNGLNFTRNFPKVNQTFSTKNCQLAQGDMSLFLNGSKHSSNYGFFDKNISVSNVKCCNSRGETNICPVSSTNDLSTQMTNLVDIPMNNYFPVNIQQAVPTIPPLYNNQVCLVNANQYQTSFNHSLAKPNPIQCVDSDVGDSFIQNSYMKPGHYAPPQKPASFQKTVNNTIPIEDIPAVGIPFLYSAPFSSTQQPKSLEFPNGLSQMQISVSQDNAKNKDADVTWKTALSMASTFRDNMLEERDIEDGPNLKISETVSLKSHFLLSDGNSSSSGDSFKGNSDNDEQSFQGSNVKFLTGKAKLKDCDKLAGSFCKLTLENENSQRFNMKQECNNSMMEDSVSKCNADLNRQEYKETYFSSSHQSNTYNDLGNIKDEGKCSQNEGGLGPCLTTQESEYLHKKPRKNKKGRDEYTLLDRKTPVLVNKTEPVAFTKSMSNKVTSQLEDILNCIWNTKVSALIAEEIKSEKEMAKLELKLRSPLYLQAMRCKLSNRSYDSLGQALADFQQYFVDIRSKSKGDKHCIEAVGALERIFVGLVEKYFGLTQQRPAPPPYGHSQSSKARRPKKTPRRL